MDGIISFSEGGFLKSKVLKDGQIKVKLPNKARGVLHRIMTYAQLQQSDPVRAQLLKEILEKLDASPTVRFRQSEIALIDETLTGLPEEISINLFALFQKQ
jgi:hypothetical protein